MTEASQATAALNSAGQAELFQTARAFLVDAREAQAAAVRVANLDIASEYWNRCDVAREKLCATLGQLEDAGVLEALSGLIPHIGEL